MREILYIKASMTNIYRNAAWSKHSSLCAFFPTRIKCSTLRIYLLLNSADMLILVACTFFFFLYWFILFFEVVILPKKRMGHEMGWVIRSFLCYFLLYPRVTLSRFSRSIYEKQLPSTPSWKNANAHKRGWRQPMLRGKQSNKKLKKGKKNSYPNVDTDNENRFLFLQVSFLFGTQVHTHN